MGIRPSSESPASHPTTPPLDYSMKQLGLPLEWMLEPQIEQLELPLFGPETRIIVPSHDPPTSKKEMDAMLCDLAAEGWMMIPGDDRRFNGDGGVGRYIECRLGVTAGNRSMADLIGWELKSSASDATLITLCHKNPDVGSMRAMVDAYGWPDKKGRQVLHHTITGESALFRIQDDGNNIMIVPKSGDGPTVGWSHSTLMVAVRKMCYMSFVKVTRVMTDGLRSIRIENVTDYSDLKLAELIPLILSGKVCIDFDVRDKVAGSRVLRDRGTKLRSNRAHFRTMYESISTVTFR